MRERMRQLLRLLVSVPVLVFAAASLPAQAVSDRPLYSRLNSVEVFAEYSNNSSHIVLGEARNRKLLTFGASYNRRILLRRLVDLQYHAELHPVAFESDPVVHVTYNIVFTNGQAPYNSTNVVRQSSPCVAGLIFKGVQKDPQGNIISTSTITGTCGRIWTFGQSFDPVGLKLNLLPRHRLQPVLTAAGGYIFSTQPIPINSAGSANFTFELGGGLEFFRSAGRSDSFFGNRSIRVEYRMQHISNNFTAQTNPGIDSGVLQVTYAFGR